MSGRVSAGIDLVQRRAAFLKAEAEQQSFALLLFFADTRCQHRPESLGHTGFSILRLLLF